MRITIEPEEGDEITKEVYLDVCEFALAAVTRQHGKTRPIQRSHLRYQTDPYALIGVLSELGARMVCNVCRLDTD